MLHTYLVDEQATTTCDHRDLARDARARKRLNCLVSLHTVTTWYNTVQPWYNMVQPWYNHGTTRYNMLQPWYSHGTTMVQHGTTMVQHGTTMVQPWYNMVQHGTTMVQHGTTCRWSHSTAHGPEGLGTYRSIIWPFRYGPVQRSCSAPRALLHIRLGTSLALQRSA